MQARVLRDRNTSRTIFDTLRNRNLKHKYLAKILNKGIIITASDALRCLIANRNELKRLDADRKLRELFEKTKLILVEKAKRNCTDALGLNNLTKHSIKRDKAIEKLISFGKLKESSAFTILSQNAREKR